MLIGRELGRRRGSGGALLALLLVVGSCGRPSDEAQLRFLAFEDSSGAALAVFPAKLESGTSSTARAALGNDSAIPGSTDAGPGVSVTLARIVYQGAGLVPPAVESPLNLYIPAGETKVVADLPLASAETKAWLIAAGAVKPVELTASATFYGRSDNGMNVETTGKVGLLLADEDLAPAGSPKTCETLCSKSGACSSHGGVNCLAGPDVDGSVICNDGTTDSTVTYHCE